MKLRIANSQHSVIAKFGVGCIVCLFLGFAILLYAQDKTKPGVAAAKPEMDSANKTEVSKMKEQAQPRMKGSRQRQNRAKADFGENAAFYEVIIDNNLFRPLGWRPPNNEPAYSVVGTAVDVDGVIAQATLLEKRSNRYHFVTIGDQLGDMTVKEIQARQVILEKGGKPITLKTNALEFLTTSPRGGGRSGRGGEGGFGRESDNAGRGEANVKRQQMEAEKRRQMEKQEQGKTLGIDPEELKEKLKDASPAERREIMREIRRRSGERRGRNRQRRDR